MPQSNEQSMVTIKLIGHYIICQPKYIGNLLKHAEVRKKEEERRVERQVQKERESEGKEFADKEAFVTSAYPFSIFSTFNLPAWFLKFP